MIVNFVSVPIDFKRFELSFPFTKIHLTERYFSCYLPDYLLVFVFYHYLT